MPFHATLRWIFATQVEDPEDAVKAIAAAALALVMGDVDTPPHYDLDGPLSRKQHYSGLGFAPVSSQTDPYHRKFQSPFFLLVPNHA